MTSKNKQMYDDFQLVFNNLASNLAPGLDIFEISMYLTKAYYTFVSQTYEQYEKSEAARKALAELVRTKTLEPTTSVAPATVSEDSLLFALPEDLLYIVYEQVKMKSEDISGCLKNKTLEVIPIKHDDLHQVYNNPFRYNENKVLRLDVSNDSGERFSEIISKNPNDIAYYFIRYIKKPKPIILEDLEDGDEIEGQSSASECVLNTIFFQDIVRLAAQLAYQDYKAV